MAELFGRRVASVGTRVAVPVLVAASALAITPGVAGAAVSNGAIAYLRPGPDLPAVKTFGPSTPMAPGPGG